MGAPGAIFIGGSGRCGTTLLRDLILAHPRVWGVEHESHFFSPPEDNLATLWAGARDGTLTAAMLTGVEAHIRNQLKRPYGRHIRARIGVEVLALRVGELFQLAASWADGAPHPEARDTIASWALGLSWPSAHKRALRWCEKSPHDVHTFLELAELYPRARLIHIVRDPRDTIDSLAAQRWTRRSGYRGVVRCCDWYAEWLDGYEAALARGLRELPGYYELRYEALVRYTRQWSMLWDHIGLSPPPRPELQPVNEGRSAEWGRAQWDGFNKLARARPRVDEWVAETRRLTGRR